MYHQLQSFNRSLPDSQISFQTGVLNGVFTLGQIFTGIIWGRIADAPWGGRKRVLIIGLAGTGVSCVGIAFSKSFASAVVWRCLGGAINGTVGAARTSLAETVEKKYHSRAFLLLPLAFNIANIFGPILGGLLAEPVRAYPLLFGPGSPFGGNDGVAWMLKYPYAAPNLLSALLLFADAALIFLGLKETQAGLKHKRDRGLELAITFRYWLSRFIFRNYGYSQLGQDDTGPGMASTEDHPMTAMNGHANTDNHKSPTKPSHNPTTVSATSIPASRMICTTPNVLLVLLTVAIFDFQMGGFASLWLVFLSSSRRDPSPTTPQTLPWHFTGGLAFPPSTLGLAMAILGFLGILLQFLLYPTVNARFGLLKSTRWSLLVFPVAYALAPYLSLLVSAADPSTGFVLWFTMTLVLLLQVGARTFALPGTILLINNSAPHPALLGTIHGLGASTSSAFRTVGPIVSGYWYSQGIKMGMVGYSWWMLSGVSVIGALASFWAKDGN